MKLAEYDGQVEQSEGLQSKSYKIATNRKSFEVLSKNLYSDRIGAVIRELSTNAADAHIAAEMRGDWTPAPFVVHLPNAVEPFFSVEDYGTGMTDNEIDELYTTYFGSNRNTSNRFTGALGLGSKSPFTYGDQFTVISTVNGERRTYTCLINAKGLPDVVPMPIACDATSNNIYVEHVDARNGVLVKVPVDEQDINEFEYKGIEILRWFNPRPNVVGSANFIWQSETYFIKNDLFGMTKDKRHRSHIVTGNVAYLLGPYDVQDLSNTERTLLTWGVDIWVDIGEVEIAANREKLTYTPATAQIVKNKLKEIIDYIREEADKFLTRASTPWEARRMIHTYRNGVMGSFLDPGKLNWNGQKISSNIYFSLYSRSPTLCERVQRGGIHKGKNYPTLRKSPTDRVVPDGSIIFVDDCFGSLKKIAYYMAVNHIDECYILSNTRNIVKSTNNKKEGFIEKDEVVDEENIEQTELPDIETSGLYETVVLASSLPDVPKMPRNKDGTTKHRQYTRLMRYQTDGNHQARDWWVNEKVDINDGGVYVVMLRFRVIIGVIDSHWNRSNYHPDELKPALDALLTLDDDEPIVYGVRPGDVDRLKKAKNWETLHSYVKDWLKDNSDDFLPRAIKLLQFAHISSCQGYLNLKRDNFDEDSPFGQFWDAVQEAKKERDSEKVKAFVELCNWAGQPVDGQVELDEKLRLDKAHERLQKAYPLLDLILPSTINSATVKHLTEYIQLIDANRKASEVPEIFTNVKKVTP